MRKVRVAVVGLNRGSILAKFILRHAKSLDLVAVADLDKKKADDFAREFKIPSVYKSRKWRNKHYLFNSQYCRHGKRS